MSIATTEQVMTVSASEVRDTFDGKNWLPACPALPWTTAPEFLPRTPELEADESRKQIATYVVLRHAGKVYSYERGPKGGEARLHRLRSVGIGGHVNFVDYDLLPDYLAAERRACRAIIRAVYRELAEEVGADARSLIQQSHFLGWISDDSDPVGRVHLGAVWAFDLYCDGVEPKDAGLKDGRWDAIADLAPAAFESWSRIVLGVIGGCAMTEPISPEDAPALAIRYTNHRGETADRRIVPRQIRFGSTEHHPEPGWIIEATDLDKGAQRSFAWEGICAAHREEVARLTKERDEARVAQAEAERDEARAEVDRLRQACSREDDAICQTLGKALGYPRYSDDPTNFPDATEADGVCVGPHVAVTLAQEAAERIKELELENGQLRKSLEYSRRQQSEQLQILEEHGWWKKEEGGGA